MRVLVTGGTKGIGRATATRLQEAGARVVVCARHARALPDGIRFIPCDLTDEAQRERLAAEVVSELGGLDVLINNAGVQIPVRLNERPPWSTIAAELAINLAAPLDLTRLLLPELIKTGRPAAIVNVTSGLAFAPKASAPVYSATKAALSSLSTTLRCQLAGTGVRVLEIVPPLVETAMTEGRKGRKWKPDRVATVIVEALQGEAHRVLVGPSRWLWVLFRVSPALAARITS